MVSDRSYQDLKQRDFITDLTMMIDNFCLSLTASLNIPHLRCLLLTFGTPPWFLLCAPFPGYSFADLAMAHSRQLQNVTRFYFCLSKNRSNYPMDTLSMVN